MEININNASGVQFNKNTEKPAEAKQNSAQEPDRENYNQNSLDKAALLNRSLVNQTSFGGYKYTGWQPKENEAAIKNKEHYNYTGWQPKIQENEPEPSTPPSVGSSAKRPNSK